jgi:hypothetical protein
MAISRGGNLRYPDGRPEAVTQIKYEAMTPLKIIFLLLAFGLVFAGGCATSNRSNLSDKPWDHPVANDHPGYDAVGEAGNEDDMK